jgi:uroporphyrin-III C-methyltransferase
MSKQKDAVVSEPVEVKQSSSGNGLSIVAILLAIAALAGSGWLMWQNEIVKQRDDATLRVGLSEITGKLDLFDASLSNLRQDSLEMVNEDQLELVIVEALNPLSDRQAEIESALVKLRDANVNRRDLVLLEDAEQLLGMAVRSASINKDANAAELALLQADEIFAELSDARLASVRAKLGNDLQALRAIEVPDIELVASRLSGLIQAVPDLPLLNEPTALDVNTASMEQSIESESEQGWKDIGREFWTDIKTMVQIQKMDQKATPLLAPEQRYFLDLNLQLILQRANLAIWQRAPMQVQRDLTEAIAWTQQYFDTNDAQVLSFLSSLQELQDEGLDVELPDLSGSYSELKNLRLEGGSL